MEVHVDSTGSLAVNAPVQVLAVALTILIGNVIKYTSQGELRIRVADGKVVISETGKAIRAEDLRRLFEHVVRGSNSGGSGSGFGHGYRDTPVRTVRLAGCT